MLLIRILILLFVQQFLKVQDKIINYNFKIKKNIIFEKPISSNYKKSLFNFKKISKI